MKKKKEAKGKIVVITDSGLTAPFLYPHFVRTLKQKYGITSIASYELFNRLKENGSILEITVQNSVSKDFIPYFIASENFTFISINVGKDTVKVNVEKDIEIGIEAETQSV